MLIPSILSAVPVEGDSLATLRGQIGKDVGSIKADMIVGIPGAVVQLFYKKDGKIDSLYTTAGRNGDFIFRKIEPQRIGLKVQSMGYESVSGVYDIAPGDNYFIFNLKEKIDSLQGASITAEIPLIRQIEDTTIYNTQIMKHADTDDLRQVLEMLPGFVVRGDAIIVDGHPVSRTFVSGTLVFGDKVTTAIDALKANEVTQVRVYDELSDIDKHRGLKNAKKNRVLDIITKEAIVSMTLASVCAAGGADCTGQPRYAAAGVLKFHSEMFESATTVDCSNIKGLSTRLSEDAGSLISQPGPLDSYKESQTINLLNTKYWKNRYYGNSLHSRYIYSHEYARTATRAIKEYYGIDDAPAMSVLDTLSELSNVARHDLMMVLALNDTRLKSFRVSFNGSIGNNRFDARRGNLTDMEGMPSGRIHQDSGRQGKDYSAKLGVSWTNNDTKKWRPFIEVSCAVSNSNTISWTVDTLSTSYLQRNLSSDGYGRGIDGSFLSGMEATIVNDKEKTAWLGLTLSAKYDNSIHRQMSYNEYGVAIPEMDMANSYDFTHNQLNSSLGAIFSLSTNSGKTLNVTASLLDATLFDTERLPVEFVNTKHYPSVGFEASYSTKIWMLAASSSAVVPAIEQVRPRISDANPLVLTSGNPNLKQGYDIAFGATFRPPTRQSGKGRNSNFTASVKGNIVLRPIVAKVRYFDSNTALTEYDGYIARAGSILNTFDNARQPRINISAQASYSKNILRHQLKYAISLGGDYLRSPMYNGEAITPIDDKALSSSFNISYNPSRRLWIVNNISASYLVSSHSSEILSSRFRISETFKVRWYITNRLRLVSDYSCAGYVYVAGTGRNHFSQILNAGIEMPVLKDKSLTIGLWGYDILNSGSLYTTEVSAAMMSQTWTPTYGRNIMIKIVYNFRKKQ